jgi:cysteine-rich repeat protein
MWKTMERLRAVSMALALAGCDAPPSAGEDAGGEMRDADRARVADARPSAPAVCGNGATEDGEACDDGDLRSGDGCRADCRSDESCGNGEIDYAAGEICDGGDTCRTCRTVEGCGDASTSGEERCDDGNTDGWDGCSAACELDVAQVVSSFDAMDEEDACDLDADGAPDSELWKALGALRFALPAFFEVQLRAGADRLALAMLGLDDGAGRDDAALHVAWLRAIDANGSDDDFDGEGLLAIDASTLSASGSAISTIGTAIESRHLEGGPEDLPVPLALFPLHLQRAQLSGETRDTEGELLAIQNGRICGGVSLSVIDLLGFALASGVSGVRVELRPACVEPERPASFVDVLIAGGVVDVETPLGPLPVSVIATAPDLDLDEDGIESFVVGGGDGDCQPVVVSCADGDGTPIEGRSCTSDPRIADGYSIALAFESIRTRLAGVRASAR